MILFLNNFNCFLNYVSSVVYMYMLIVLLMIELVVFNMTLIMGMVLLFIMDLDFYLIYYMVCSLCESGVGMSMLILIVRYYGNDMYYFMNL